MATLTIEWRHLVANGATCERCDATGVALAAALHRLGGELEAEGHQVQFTEQALGPEALSESNLIRFNGRPLEDWLGAESVVTPCASCGDLIGAAACCRAVSINGQIFEAIPEAMIHTAARAALNEGQVSMKTIKILGTGCANCDNTARLMAEVAAALGVAVQIDKVTDIGQILGYGVMSTPGVVIDGQVVHAGSVPSRQAVEDWLSH